MSNTHHLLTAGWDLSSSLSRFCWSCRWKDWFSSDILIFRALTWVWTLERVCMHCKVVAACRWTDCPCTNVFNLDKPLNARNDLLAWKKAPKQSLSYTRIWLMQPQLRSRYKKLNVAATIVIVYYNLKPWLYMKVTKTCLVPFARLRIGSPLS